MWVLVYREVLLIYRKNYLRANLAVFQGQHIRKVFHDGEWWFSIIDVSEVLVGVTAAKILERLEKQVNFIRLY